jgi:hypothetical protein
MVALMASHASPMDERMSINGPTIRAESAPLFAVEATWRAVMATSVLLWRLSERLQD